jgi:aldehyde dehydrogenase (NAD+)
MTRYGDGIEIVHPDRMYINGEWRAPLEPVPWSLIDPSTEEELRGFVLGGEADASAAIAAARHAFDTGPWAHLDVRERSALVARLADALESRHAELEEAWTRQVGALPMMRGRAITNGIGPLRLAAELGAELSFEKKAQSAMGDAMIMLEPVGVVSAIAAWNGPLLQMANKVGPALVAGCTVIMKPSEQTPIEALLIAECADAIGIPPGVLNLVTLGRDASNCLVSDTRVDKVSFTGSTAVGRHIARTCGDRIARYSLELGGKSAAIVLDDADISLVGKTMARTITALSGQLCSMLSRVIVSADRHDRLAEAIAAEMAKVRVGSAYDPATEMGPVASRRQLERIEDYIKKGRAEGARLASGGARPAAINKGFYLEPTLFADVAPEATIAQEEIFGPVLSLIRARNDEDAVRIANQSAYGLHGSVFTPDKERARAIARRVRTGTFAQNGMKLDFALPFGGVKQSGVGREGGKAALEPYLESKTVLLDL